MNHSDADSTRCLCGVAPFLKLLERDLAQHPERLRGMPRGLHERLLAVTEGVEIKPDEPIDGSVAL